MNAMMNVITIRRASAPRRPLGRLVKSFVCLAVNGHHELYRAWSANRVFQRCVICGHETHGWDVTPRHRCAR